MPWWGSIAIKFVVDFLARIIGDKRRDGELKDAGKVEAERDQAAEGGRVEADLAEQATHRVGEDDAIARLREGRG